MRIMFWNLRHLGAGTDEFRKKAIKTVYDGLKPDYALFCELVTTSTFPAPVNLTYRLQNPYQLCYGCLDSAGNNFGLTRSVPTVTDVYKEANFKGGNDFTQLADRALGYVGIVGGAHLYVLHAPSGGGSARKAVSFAACYLDETWGNTAKWVMIGDLNVEPSPLALSPVGIELGGLIMDPEVTTYIGPTKDKTFDYAMANFDVSVGRARVSPRSHGSDHYPVYAEW
jgi:hypothetical protein